MQTARQTEFLSVEEYLEGEQQSEIRHEYLGGMAYAMAGGTDVHNALCMNVAFALRNHLRGGPCRVFMADVKVHLLLSERELFYYPDVMVTCDPRDTEPYFKEFPKVLVEVLSESTERTDRMEKFSNYTQLPSLEEYILVAQDEIQVTVFRRSTNWQPEVLNQLEQRLAIPALKLDLPLRAIYESVLP